MSDKHYSFKLAMKALRGGAMIARKGWMADGIFIFQLPGITISKDRIDEFAKFSDQVKYKLKSINTDIVFNPTISMVDSENKIQAGWVAYDEDFDANDWIIL